MEANRWLAMVVPTSCQPRYRIFPRAFVVAGLDNNFGNYFGTGFFISAEPYLLPLLMWRSAVNLVAKVIRVAAVIGRMVERQLRTKLAARLWARIAENLASDVAIHAVVGRWLTTRLMVGVWPSKKPLVNKAAVNDVNYLSRFNVT